jgi:hypothetical protein
VLIMAPQEVSSSLTLCWMCEVGQRHKTICVPRRRSDTLGLACGTVALPRMRQPKQE